MTQTDDTIYAPATPPGTSALAILRLSGPEAVSIAKKVFRPAAGQTDLEKVASHTAHFGSVFNDGELLDEVVLTLFRAPRSYTGQDLVEISCHGSTYIMQRLCDVLSKSGARLADAGEFTLRAFLNGKFDLSQAEAVADLIAAQSKISHDVAIRQMRGGFSKDISILRSRLLEFATLITLEMDFSEEDLEFADRKQLKELLDEINRNIRKLIASFETGNVIKNGVAVVITGKPNVGKSTLLNAVLREDRAIVSEIPGTTRDTIEDTIDINGLLFRFIDTAGLQPGGDALEQMGMLRTVEKIARARIILYVIDISQTKADEVITILKEIENSVSGEKKTYIVVANKTDLVKKIPTDFENIGHQVVFVSAKQGENIQHLLHTLLQAVTTENIHEHTIVTNARHLEALKRTQEAIEKIYEGLLSGLSIDLLSVEINQALHYLGLITGEISNEEVLGNIFGRFCIGK